MHLFLLDFQWQDLLNPEFYILHGGLWVLVFILFAETGLFAGFFLPGDSLLFVAGIYSANLAQQIIPAGNEWADLFVLWILLSLSGIFGNFVGYWFGKRSGRFLYEKKDNFLYKKKYLLQATEFYEKYGGFAIIAARFVPIIRTFAPIVAGVVKMDWKKFILYNIIGCISWVATMLLAGHFLYKWALTKGIDLKQHLDLIVIVIVLVSTVPIIVKLISAKNENKKING